MAAQPLEHAATSRTAQHGSHKQPHEPQIHPCTKAGANAAVLDIQPVEHYCTPDPPTRHRTQCEQAMSLDTQLQNHLTPPGGQRHYQ